ncbi:MAG: CoA-binding protein [Bacteroidales bacterium]|nr:CoA-binding protein [Bacteroidales bacterium]MBN2748237.1 CoA-binding protein [Bacteroidales bacterium]
MLTLVIGASTNPRRFSHMAINKLIEHGHEVVALGSSKGFVGSVKIETDKLPFKNIHTITLYLNPERQMEYYGYLLSLHPKRIVFNPGTENQELFKLAKEAGIEVVFDCTLVMLMNNRY